MLSMICVMSSAKANFLPSKIITLNIQVHNSFQLTACQQDAYMVKHKNPNYVWHVVNIPL